jgi:hypothetical protein
MKIRIAAALAIAAFLSACSDGDWDHALTYTGLSSTHSDSADAQAAVATQPAPMVAQAAPASATVAADGAPKPNAFCESVASQDAGGNDFDPATQRRVFVQSYQQCVAVFGDAAK